MIYLFILLTLYDGKGIYFKGGRGVAAESGRTAAAGQTQRRRPKRAVQKNKQKRILTKTYIFKAIKDQDKA